MITSWHSYPKIYALGHSAVRELLDDDVVVQEKVDGSQFSFGVFEHPEAEGDCILRVRSKGAVMHPEAPEKMFTKAVEAVKAVQHLLIPGWTYRAEYLSKPKHNALAYDRVPRNHLALFDVNTGEEVYQSPGAILTEAERLGFEAVPLIHHGRITSIEQFREMLDRTSFLGGQKIEGVVAKNYRRFGPDKKVLMGKFVSEAFKEVHAREWGDANPGPKDIITQIIDAHRTPARWAKAVQHLRDVGKLEGSPRDIGLLIVETKKDIFEECKDDMLKALWQYARPHIERGVIRGLPEWYKDELLKKQFEGDAAP